MQLPLRGFPIASVFATKSNFQLASTTGSQSKYPVVVVIHIHFPFGSLSTSWARTALPTGPIITL